jgi:hypothetical protein
VAVVVCPSRTDQVGRVGSVLLGPGNVILDHRDKEPDRDFGTHWGIFEFTPEVERYLSPEAATGGYLISEALEHDLDVRGYLVEYPYFDCGTFREYLQCLAHLDAAKAL